jgi:hypothetical protein
MKYASQASHANTSVRQCNYVQPYILSVLTNKQLAFYFITTSLIELFLTIPSLEPNGSHSSIWHPSYIAAVFSPVPSAWRSDLLSCLVLTSTKSADISISQSHSSSFFRLHLHVCRVRPSSSSSLSPTLGSSLFLLRWEDAAVGSPTFSRLYKPCRLMTRSRAEW